jgi:ubiquitin C-terminal hydrolase
MLASTTPGQRGLFNMGNTFYMNTVLQLLLLVTVCMLCQQILMYIFYTQAIPNTLHQTLITVTSRSCTSTCWTRTEASRSMSTMATR